MVPPVAPVPKLTRYPFFQAGDGQSLGFSGTQLRNEIASDDSPETFTSSSSPGTVHVTFSNVTSRASSKLTDDSSLRTVASRTVNPFTSDAVMSFLHVTSARSMSTFVRGDSGMPVAFTN